MDKQEDIMEQIFGTLAMLMSLAISLFGFPTQIWRNYKRRSTEGLEAKLVYSAFAAYTMWMLYGIVKADGFLIWSQAPGVLMTLIAIGQIVYYGHTKLSSFEQSILVQLIQYKEVERDDLLAMVRVDRESPDRHYWIGALKRLQSRGLLDARRETRTLPGAWYFSLSITKRGEQVLALNAMPDTASSM